ncbi:hypothetical protein Peur_008519 [Populus x canadensis]
MLNDLVFLFWNSFFLTCMVFFLIVVLRNLVQSYLLFLCCIECYNITLFVINVIFISSTISNTLCCQVVISHCCFHISKLQLIITTNLCVVNVFYYIASRKLTY